MIVFDQIHLSANIRNKHNYICFMKLKIMGSTSSLRKQRRTIAVHEAAPRQRVKLKTIKMNSVSA